VPYETKRSITKMNTQSFKIGMAVRYENQKWKGTVVGIREEEIEVIFEGDGALEFIDPMYLRPF
jgi:hypothetical protein